MIGEKSSHGHAVHGRSGSASSATPLAPLVLCNPTPAFPGLLMSILSSVSCVSLARLGTESFCAVPTRRSSLSPCHVARGSRDGGRHKRSFVYEPGFFPASHEVKSCRPGRSLPLLSRLPRLPSNFQSYFLHLHSTRKLKTLALSRGAHFFFPINFR